MRSVSDDAVANLVAAPPAPGRALLQPHLFGGGQGLPEAEWKRLGVPEVLRQLEDHLPLAVDEVPPHVGHRDVVLDGALLENPQRSGFRQRGNIHTLITDNGFLPAAGTLGTAYAAEVARHSHARL
ncbi:hypothetical protein [Streptomyces calidiresistens]|uniref:Uncharacterized protein n=1 Tax=Streptomyces calidiresistens TaxID=1485586 RepID=A0A7W3XXM3_9ACTN|nr:hypothetical protein [Streptomyces calidiresistens]MBB0230947.1 hypothetical protein [Streptomyces calidiresistens]